MRWNYQFLTRLASDPRMHIQSCCVGCNIVLCHTAIYHEPSVSYFLSKQSFVSFAIPIPWDDTCHYQIQPSLLDECHEDFAIDHGAFLERRRWCLAGGFRQLRGPSHDTRIICTKSLYVCLNALSDTDVNAEVEIESADIWGFFLQSERIGYYGMNWW